MCINWLSSELHGIPVCVWGGVCATYFKGKKGVTYFKGLGLEIYALYFFACVTLDTSLHISGCHDEENEGKDLRLLFPL